MSYFPADCSRCGAVYMAGVVGDFHFTCPCLHEGKDTYLTDEQAVAHKEARRALAPTLLDRAVQDARECLLLPPGAADHYTRLLAAHVIALAELLQRAHEAETERDRLRDALRKLHEEAAADGYLANVHNLGRGPLRHIRDAVDAAMRPPVEPTEPTT